MSVKLKIKKGDTVKVTTGVSKNKEGKVLSVDPEKQKVIVEGVNIVKRHTKPSAQNPNGGIVEKEAPIHVSNVVLMVDGNPTKVGRKVVDGKIKRFAKNNPEKIID